MTAASQSLKLPRVSYVRSHHANSTPDRPAGLRGGHSDVGVLGNYEAKEAVPGLMELLKDKDRHVRRSAAYALARFGRDASDAIPSLKEALKDDDPKVREAVAYAIKEIQNPHTKQKSSQKETRKGGK